MKGETKMKEDEERAFLQRILSKKSYSKGSIQRGFTRGKGGAKDWDVLVSKLNWIVARGIAVVQTAAFSGAMIRALVTGSHLTEVGGFFGWEGKPRAHLPLSDGK